MTWNVGDEIIVREKAYWGNKPGDVRPYVVTKVARKYFYADARDSTWPRDVAFEIDGGREKDNGSNYHARAYTPEQWEAKQHRDALNERLFAHKVRFDWASQFGSDGHRLSNAAVEAILDILDAERHRINEAVAE